MNEFQIAKHNNYAHINVGTDEFDLNFFEKKFTCVYNVIVICNYCVFYQIKINIFTVISLL